VQPVNIKITSSIFFYFTYKSSGKHLGGESMEKLYLNFSHTFHWHPNAGLVCVWCTVPLVKTFRVNESHDAKFTAYMSAVFDSEHDVGRIMYCHSVHIWAF
jgi:hypothetical protein